MAGAGKFRAKLTRDDRSELIQLRREGVSIKDLAIAFGINKSAVQYHLRQVGLDGIQPVSSASDDEIDTAVVPSDISWGIWRWEKWMAEGDCAQVDPDLWFPDKGASPSDAKAICAGCPVRVQCLNYALEYDEPFGIWGGKTERERRAIEPDHQPLTQQHQESA